MLLGNGDGTFRTAASYGAGLNPYSVAVGDFNGDGKRDLAVATREFVAVLLGKGDGTFRTAVNYAAGLNPGSVVVGDFNGDGKPDLAVANYDSNNVSVLLGNGDGTFEAAVNYLTGLNPYSVAVGDFNGDGKRDLMVANAGGGVSILLNTTGFEASPNVVGHTKVEGTAIIDAGLVLGASAESVQRTVPGASVISEKPGSRGAVDLQQH